ncbi:MAG TPA: hypothetical protein VF484_04610 [Candidatus Limnocylindrales bacterium]
MSRTVNYKHAIRLAELIEYAQHRIGQGQQWGDDEFTAAFAATAQSILDGDSRGQTIALAIEAYDQAEADQSAQLDRYRQQREAAQAAELRTRQAPCAFCHAPAGEACRTASGATKPTSHADRAQAT